MGHERVQSFPNSKRWQEIVELLNGYPQRSQKAQSVEDIAASVIENVEDRFREAHQDRGVASTFQFLLLLCASGKYQNPHSAFRERGLDLPENPSRIELLSAANQWIEESVSGNESREYKELAVKALADTLGHWHDARKLASQHSIFEESTSSLDFWESASDGAGFTEVAQTFFARFTERYLKYFLDREASNTILQIDRRERFQAEVSQHANETARITREFSAGWYNKNVGREPPGIDEVKSFLWKAFGKIRDELSREASNE
jgi:hypothetical protein